MQQMNSSIQLFIHIAIFIALIVFLVSGLQTLYTVIDIFITSETATWYDYRSGVFYRLPGTTAFFIISSIALLLLSKKAFSLPTSPTEGWQEIVNRFIIMGSLIGSAALTLVSSGILLTNLLEGDLSLNSITKLVITAIIGIIIFLYYRGILHDTWNKDKKKLKIVALLFTLLTTILIITAIIIINPLQRADKDDTYINLDDLKSTHQGVLGYYDKNDTLPTTYSQETYRGEETEITYTKINEEEFELCTTIKALPEYTDLEGYPFKKYPVTIGENCFTLNTDPNESPYPSKIPPTPSGV